MTRGSFVVAILLVGCAAEKTPSSEPGAADLGDVLLGAAGATSSVGPYRVTCSIYHRVMTASPLPEHERTSIVLRTDEPREASTTVSARAIPVHVALAPAADPAEVAVTVRFPASNLQQQFTLPRDRKPAREFGGEHGFTGLNYVAAGSDVDVQYICEASALDEARPKPPPDPSSFSAQPERAPAPPTPARIRCEVAIEGGRPVVETVALEGPAKEVVVANGTIAVRLVLNDDGSEGRSLFLQVMADMAPRLRGTIQQLFQLDRAVPLASYPSSAVSGMTGRTTVRLGGDTARVSCHAD
jgi:hypothetical protein